MLPSAARASSAAAAGSNGKFSAAAMNFRLSRDQRGRQAFQAELQAAGCARSRQLLDQWWPAGI
jgi:hypothetical protein